MALRRGTAGADDLNDVDRGQAAVTPANTQPVEADRLADRPDVQPRLSVSHVDDLLEPEADALAAGVVSRAAAPVTVTAPSGPAQPSVAGPAPEPEPLARGRTAPRPTPSASLRQRDGRRVDAGRVVGRTPTPVGRQGPDSAVPGGAPVGEVSAELESYITHVSGGTALPGIPDARATEDDTLGFRSSQDDKGPSAATESRQWGGEAPGVAVAVKSEGATLAESEQGSGKPVAPAEGAAGVPQVVGMGGGLPALPAAAVVGGGGGAAPVSLRPPTDGAPSELLGALANALMSKAAEFLAAAEDASPAAFDQQRQAAQATLPQIPAPTGIPAGTRSGKARADRPAAAPGAKDVPALAESQPEQKQDNQVPQAPPAPALRPTVLAGGHASAAPTDGTGEDQRDPVLERSAQAALADVDLPSDMVPRDPGPPPEVDLGGAADPAQMHHADRAASAEAAAHHSQALSEVGVDRGENDIRPAPDDGVLQAQLTPGTRPTPGGKGIAAGQDLPPKVLTAVDAQATPILHERMGAETEKYASAQAEYQAGSEAARGTATAETRRLEAEARASQEGAREDAQAEVTSARADWHGEIEGVHQQFRTDAASASAEHGQQIREHVETGNREARQHMQQAEQNAAAETQKAEVEAEGKKKEAEEESGGFWGWVKSKAKALIDGLKQAVNFIYDNLRKAVRALFEAAKKLAMAAIELARTAIVGLIKAFGAALKALVSVALAAFPGIRDKFLQRIDAAVNKATDLVNKAADGLKTAVAAVLDFLASTIDQLLGLVQDVYNGILTVVGMLISGELAELLEKLGHLWEAAKTAPGQFETAAYEELLGGNLDEPLSQAELIAAGRTPPEMASTGPESSGTGTGMVAGEHAAADGEEVETPQAPWKEDNVGVEDVVSGVELSPELTAELLSRAGDNGGIEFGQSQDADRSLESILGTQTGGQQQQTTSHAQQEHAKASDGLTPRERAEVKWTVMKQGLAQWWSDNWPYVIGGGIAAVAGFIAANILTGGAILAAMPTLMSVVGYLFAGVLVMQLAGHLRDFLQKGWNGDAQGGGKSLAKGLAAGAIELISWLTFKAGSAALKGAKAAAKGFVKGAQAAGRVGVKAVRGAVNIVKRGANYFVKGGKVLLRGAGDAVERGVKSLRELGERLLARTKFRGFRIKINGRRFRLEGHINPWVLLADGTIKWESRRGHGGLGARTTVDGQDALVLSNIRADPFLKDLFQARPQAADDMLALARRADVDPPSILRGLKDLSPEEAEQLLKQLRQLKEVDEAHLIAAISKYRQRHGKPKIEDSGGTVAAGQADIPDVDPGIHTGGSPLAQSGTPMHNLRFGHPGRGKNWAQVLDNHAEQTVLGDIAAKIDDVYKGVKRADEIVGTVKMTVDQAVCNACRSGFGSGAAGIIKQFSDEFPKVTVMITAAQTNEILIVKGGKILGRR